MRYRNEQTNCMNIKIRINKMHLGVDNPTVNFNIAIDIQGVLCESKIFCYRGENGTPCII